MKKQLKKSVYGNYLGITETVQNGPVPNGPWTPICYALYGPTLCNGVTEFFPWHGDKLIEWDAETQEVVWEWNTFDHFLKISSKSY